MEISNFPYNRHFFQTAMKIWYDARAKSLFIFLKVKVVTSQARFRCTGDKLINLTKCLQECKSSMEFRNCDSNPRKVKYESVRKKHLDLICFCRTFSLAFLLSYLFTAGYYISARIEISSTQAEIFHIFAISFNSLYRVEISTRNENLHIIGPYDFRMSILKMTS